MPNKPERKTLNGIRVKSMNNMIILGDNREELKKFPDNYFSAIVVSPPYKDSDGYSEGLIRDSFNEGFRTLKDDSLCFVNFGHLAEDKFRPFRVCQILMEIGFKLNETIVWEKNQYRPLQGKKRLNNVSEFIFMLYKGEMPDLDRMSIGIPHKDPSNIKRFGNPLKCSSNVWHFGYETIQKSSDKLHPDRFALELPLRCLKLSGLKNGLVLDPFCGSGTTGVAANQLNLDFVGIEKNPVHYETSCRRLNIPIE